jgi:hypothetical protein
MPDPDILDIFEQVYEEITPELASQRDTMAAYLATFEDASDAAADGVLR